MLRCTILLLSPVCGARSATAPARPAPGVPAPRLAPPSLDTIVVYILAGRGAQAHTELKKAQRAQSSTNSHTQNSKTLRARRVPPCRAVRRVCRCRICENMRVLFSAPARDFALARLKFSHKHNSTRRERHSRRSTRHERAARGRETGRAYLKSSPRHVGGRASVAAANRQWVGATPLRRAT